MVNDAPEGEAAVDKREHDNDVPEEPSKKKAVRRNSASSGSENEKEPKPKSTTKLDL